MNEQEYLLAQQEARERAVLDWNARESIRRTQEKLRQGMIAERRQWFSYTQGVPVKAYTEEELQRMFPEPQGTIGPMFNQAPRAEYVDDSRANNFQAQSIAPDEKRKLWFELLSRTPPPANRASSQMAEANSLSLQIRERRR